MDDDPIGIRIGTFFLVLGVGTFVLFVLSDIAQTPDFDYLFGALLLIAFGWFLRRKKAPPPPAGRFSWLKGLRKGKKKDAPQKAPTEE